MIRSIAEAAGLSFINNLMRIIIMNITLNQYLDRCRFFRESPRWLLTSGRYERAEKCITAIASINGKVFSEMDAMHLRQSYLDHETLYGGAIGDFRRDSGGMKQRSMFEPSVRCNTICTFIIM